MKPYKHFILGAFAMLSLLSLHSAYAATSKTPTTTAAPVSTKQSIPLVPIATVNIQDAKILSQNGNTLTFSFNLTNREGLQTGVRYGVKLFAPQGQFPLDEKTYPESLTLAPNSSVSKEITYTAPSALNGTYSVLISSANENGFPFGLTPLGTVTFTSDSKGISIAPETCHLSVDGEAGNRSYGIMQNVDIEPTENMHVSCVATNLSNEEVTATPSYETRAGSIYGEVVATTGGDTAPIPFGKLEKKTITLALPKASDPKSYNVSLSLSTNGVTSNVLSIRYAIRGAAASIQNLSFDKDYYADGDQAKLVLVWMPLNTTHVRPVTSSSVDTGSMVLGISITNDSGRKCGAPISEQLSSDFTKSPETPIIFSSTSNCYNPKATVTLTDSKGNVLDTKAFEVKTTSVKRPGPGPLSFIGLAIILIIISAVIVRMKKYKKGDTDYMDGVHPIIKMIVPLIVVMTGFMFTHTASADTFYVGTAGAYITGNIDKSTYAPGENISVTTYLDMGVYPSYSVPLDGSGNPNTFPAYVYESNTTFPTQWNAYTLSVSTTGNAAVDLHKPTSAIEYCQWHNYSAYSGEYLGTITGDPCSMPGLNAPAWGLRYIMYSTWHQTTTILKAPTTPGSYNVTFSAAYNEPPATINLYANDYSSGSGGDGGGIDLGGSGSVGGGITAYVNLYNNTNGQSYSINTSSSGLIEVPKGNYTITSESINGCGNPSFQPANGTNFTLTPSSPNYDIYANCY